MSATCQHETAEDRAKALQSHIDEWEALATEQDRWAEYYTSRGEYAGVSKTKAGIYRRTAESMRMEAATGFWHCTCHLKRVEACILLSRK